MKKNFRRIPGGKIKVEQHRFSGDFASCEKAPRGNARSEAQFLQEEIQDALGNERPAQEVQKDLAVVVSCGLACDDDTEGTNHWYIPVELPKPEPVSKPEPIQKSGFRPARRQLLPIDSAICRSA